MIVICIIVAVIGSFVCTLIKVRIDEWLENLSMSKQKRLSLKRNANFRYDTNDVIEITDDESSDSFPCSKKGIEQEDCANITSYGATNVLNNITHTSSTACSSKPMHESLDNSDGNNDIVILNDIPGPSNRGQSMFNWNKTSFANRSLSRSNVSHENSTLHDSEYEEEMPEEASNKKQKLNSWISVNNDDLQNPNNVKEENPPPQVTTHHDKIIAGTKVKFPINPYPCQVAVMNSLIQACNKEQNCLLESPTGSGKTLALLCGVLAWQEQYSENVRQQESSETGADNSCCNNKDSLDNNFFLNSTQYFDDEWYDKVLQVNKAGRVPKVYYGTRTHKQIEQVVREFKKTAYSHKRMTILSSRDHTCIQDTERNKTELCHELLDPLKHKRCQYYNETSKKNMPSFGNLETPWDIEDLVSMGQEINVCPYFGARSLMPDAEIIFCPYNYIVDPDIRKSMQINLKGHIVILDEAHNIEDNCRQTASVSLRDDDLTIAAKECENLSNKRMSDRNSYIILQKYLADVAKFMKDIEVQENSNGWEMVSNYWLGAEFLELLDINNKGRSRFPTFLAASKAAIEDFEQMMEENRKNNKMLPTISRNTKTILEHLCFAMQMIISENFVNDYRVYVVETNEPKRIMPNNTEMSTNNRLRTLKLMCMNPAVIFAPLAHLVRSVILASGTLSPTSSFQSELGTQFPHILNANHVIPEEQVYVRCISRGPNRKPLLATYDNVNSYNFQDELGNLVLEVCDAVPYGVLCFFSSYNVMSKLLERWQSNGTWKKLLKLKEIFVEPRQGTRLPVIMNAYRNVIKKSSSISFREPSGAILFAVFRGKVAEGIDFSDNEARCVLAIGIPYSYKRNPDVSMKMNYNDSNISKELLSGSEWYTVCAFRALNQALGRCIRHIKDWGAVLLVDERFQKQQNINYLPKWIKTMWKRDQNYDLQTELEDFVALQVAREREERDRKNKEKKI